MRTGNGWRAARDAAAGLATVVVAAACAGGVSVVPRGSGGGVQVASGVGGGIAAGSAGGWSDTPGLLRGRVRRAPAALAGAEGVRRVCRTAARPQGWVAVAYERGGDRCPGRAAGDSAVTTALLVRVDGSAIGTRLDVCADQPIPAGWRRADDEAPGDAGACPGAERGGRPGVRRIVRVS